MLEGKIAIPVEKLGEQVIEMAEGEEIEKEKIETRKLISQD